jgi:RNA polymerase sigma-70 factor (ECF subfamily)
MYSAGVLCPLDQSEEQDEAGEDDLVTAAQSGSESAFRELCRRNARHVFCSISRVTGDYADAEDALQDSRMRVFVPIRRFDRRSSFSTWLTRIGINSALMILRKKRRIRETSVDFVNSDKSMTRQ